MNKLIIEFLGTFFLVLVIALTGNPVAIGAVLTALVYMGGYISGANYNPAVTIALLVTRKMGSDLAVRYIIAQILGGFTAATLFLAVKGTNFVPAPGLETPILTSFIIESVFTFLLASVVLHTAVAKKTKGNDYYGLAIGLTVTAIAFAGGPISGGVFNPAVAVGPIISDFANIGSNVQNLLLYIFAPSLGGILAGLAFRFEK